MLYQTDKLEVTKMTLLATVLSVQPDSLLVWDHASRQRIRVNTRHARRFRRGDLVRIWYNGIMTFSIPPQISATRIVPVSRFQARPGRR